jgi:TonB family protein
VPPLPLHPKELYPKKTFTKPAAPEKWSKHIKKAKKDYKKNMGPEFSSLQTEKEATVSLYADYKKDSKYSSYLAHLRYKIDSVWEYPSYAKERGIEGELTLCFAIGENGSLINAKLLDPSGHPTLDQEAVRAIKDAAPFRHFPDGFSISRLNVLASFKYQFSAE